ncbi:MAG: hypothetical protein KKD05_06445, partial [Candidatus Omnitrophica bacterium]|nr:hypothetical protein [Candidatus Omnitrophota bacterium]
MDKDKNFITAIVLTIMVIFFYPMLMKKIFPDKFTEPQQQISQTAALNQTEIPIVQSNISSAITYSKTKSYTLETNKYNVIVNSPGADIRSIDFSQIPDPATNLPTNLMDTQDQIPGIFSTPELIRNAELQNVDVQADALEFTYK